MFEIQVKKNKFPGLELVLPSSIRLPTLLLPLSLLLPLPSLSPLALFSLPGTVPSLSPLSTTTSLFFNFIYKLDFQCQEHETATNEEVTGLLHLQLSQQSPVSPSTTHTSSDIIQLFSPKDSIPHNGLLFIHLQIIQRISSISSWYYQHIIISSQVYSTGKFVSELSLSFQLKNDSLGMPLELIQDAWEWDLESVHPGRYSSLTFRESMSRLTLSCFAVFQTFTVSLCPFLLPQNHFFSFPIISLSFRPLSFLPSPIFPFSFILQFRNSLL